MTPIEAAVKAGEDRRMTSERDGWTGLITDCDARAIITAFLEAAAEDAAMCEASGEAAFRGYLDTGIEATMGKAAILALKEAVNG